MNNRKILNFPHSAENSINLVSWRIEMFSRKSFLCFWFDGKITRLQYRLHRWYLLGLHSVEITEIYSHIFWSTFVKVTFLVGWFHEIFYETFFGVREFLIFPQCDLNHITAVILRYNSNTIIYNRRPQCGKYRNVLSYFFDKNFVKATF